LRRRSEGDRAARCTSRSAVRAAAPEHRQRKRALRNRACSARSPESVLLTLYYPLAASIKFVLPKFATLGPHPRSVSLIIILPGAEGSTRSVVQEKLLGGKFVRLARCRGQPRAGGGFALRKQLSRDHGMHASRPVHSAPATTPHLLLPPSISVNLLRPDLLSETEEIGRNQHRAHVCSPREENGARRPRSLRRLQLHRVASNCTFDASMNGARSTKVASRRDTR
jgi:hypothetical protein